MRAANPVGKTKTQGWEIGVSRTLPISPLLAWEALIHAFDLPPVVITSGLDRGETFTTSDGTEGEIRSFELGSLIRMRWKPREWESPSTLQFRVMPAKTGTRVSIHHEWLPDGDARQELRQHYTNLLEGLKG